MGEKIIMANKSAEPADGVGRPDLGRRQFEYRGKHGV